jgi:hypothetical protein
VPKVNKKKKTQLFILSYFCSIDLILKPWIIWEIARQKALWLYNLFVVGPMDLFHARERGRKKRHIYLLVR